MPEKEFARLLERAAALPDAELQRPWEWPGHSGGETLDIRHALYLCIQEEDGALAGQSLLPTTAGRIMAQSQAAFGDLRGLLAGQPDELLDADPGGGQWTLRQVLEHVLLVELRYRAHVEHAVHRADSDPVRARVDVQADVRGGVVEVLDRLEEARTRTRAFCALADDVLHRPTIWAGHSVDVRFRLHRFGAHLAEHTIHCEKTLAALDREPGEARRIARLLSAARGAHEWQTPPEGLEELDRGHAERLAGHL